MKKVFFVLVFVFITTAVFSQELIYTSDGGRFMAGIQYEGQYRGQLLANNESGISGVVSVRLSNGELEVVRRMLNKYSSTRGDTYMISFCAINIDGSIGRYWFTVFCEYTSSTQYNYWAFRAPNPPR